MKDWTSNQSFVNLIPKSYGESGMKLLQASTNRFPLEAQDLAILVVWAIHLLLLSMGMN